jgi:DnaJ-class molecular chaperone
MSIKHSILLAAAMQALSQDDASDVITSCSECAGSGMTTYAKRGFYQTTCRKCWGKGHIVEKRTDARAERGQGSTP